MTVESYRIVRRIEHADLAAIARIHLLAFPNSALTSLGIEATRRYYEWQLTGPHDVVAACIVESGEITAFCFGGLFRGALGGFLRANRRYLFWRVVTRPWLLTNEIVRQRIRMAAGSLARRYLPSSTNSGAANSSSRKTTFGILSIAVHPNKSGTGQGRCLVNCMEQAAQERQFAGMHLTVSPHNRGAIAFYERLGWTRDLNKRGAWTGGMRKNISQ